MLRIVSFLAVLLALVSQLALGAMVIPDDAAELAALDAVSIVCEPTQGTPDTPPPPHHHTADLCLCPLSIALALPAAILSPAPALPTPTTGHPIHPHRAAQPRAPPTQDFAAAYPRGPPHLV